MVARPVTFELNADLRKFALQLDLNVGRVRRKIANDLMRRMAIGTPVDTGRLRNNWYLGDGEPPLNSTEEVDEKSLGHVLNVSNKAFETSWIVNNLLYAVRIEFGWSRQAPNGMVRLSLAEMEASLQAVTVLP